LLKPSGHQAGSAAAAESSRKPAPSRRPRTAARQSTNKLFVLDTNVLMHDPTSLFRFEEHDVFLPIMTLEELDNNKNGISEIARNARQASRFLDDIVSHAKQPIAEGIPLRRHEADPARGRLFLQTEAINGHIPANLPIGKTDNFIIGVMIFLKKRDPRREVILVSKDINMRIKARALGLTAEDYFSDKVLEDSDLLYTGVRELPADFWDHHGRDIESWKREGRTYYRIRDRFARNCCSTNSVIRTASGRCSPLPWRSPTEPRCSRPFGTTPTARTTSGESRRETASKTSRSTCS